MVKQEISRLLDLQVEFENELERILKFWSTKCVDEINGGFIGTMDHYGKVELKASKGCILNARILWTFSAAYRKTNNESYRVTAVRAYDYLKKYFWDDINGGLYWELDYLGNKSDRKKQAYVQGFGIYAFSEYFRATGSQESLTYAKDLFYILENKFWEPKFAGYLEALGENWETLDDMRLSQKDLNTPKSMNTHLHILEPYTNLYRVWPEPQLKNSIEFLLQLFSKKIFDPETRHLNLFFSKDWKPQFQEISFGHDIEAAWLMNEASMVINKGELDQEIHLITKQLVDATVNEGLDHDGSLFNEIKGAELDSDKHWWPQAEAMVGFMDAFELELDQKHIRQIEKLWIFIKDHVLDLENGEWFWRVDKTNKEVSSEDKVGFWKCPYHNSRALMELIQRIDKLKQDDRTN